LSIYPLSTATKKKRGDRFVLMVVSQSVIVFSHRCLRQLFFLLRLLRFVQYKRGYTSTKRWNVAEKEKKKKRSDMN